MSTEKDRARPIYGNCGNSVQEAASVGKTAVSFPGEGSQAVGMGREVAETSTHAAGAFGWANELLDFDVGQYCFEGAADGVEPALAEALA